MAKRKPLFSPYPFLSIFIFIFFCSNTIADENGYLLKLSKSLSSTPSDWSGSDPCKWSGINCESGSVTSIDLSSKSLTGSIPSDLNQLTKLQSVSFQNNQITGPLPNFSNLTSLKSIYLNTNNFTSVPDSIFYGLPSLQTLSLSDNLNLSPWVFPQDLAQSDSLDSIYADSVNLMGQIPDFVGSLLSLQNLRLSYNNLTGVLPSSLAGSDIRNIWVNNQLMGLSGSIDVLGTMTQVSQVWFHKNLFTGSIPDLSNCTSIFDLQLRDNFLAGVVPPSLISLPQLVNVSLANNKLQGPYPDFKPGVLVNIGAQNSFCNPKPGPCDPQVMTLLEIAGALSYPKSLADSWVGNNACAGDWVGILCDPQAKNVTVLNFGKRHFGGTISPAISKLTSLKNLLLNDNNLTGSIPASLTSLTELQTIDVTNNNLSGKIPEFSSKVNLKPNGNPLLGTDLPPSGDPSSNKSTSADQSGRHKSSAVSAGMVAGIIIAVLIFMGVVFLVGYKYYTKKHHGNFGSLESPISGKELVKNSEVGTSGRNGYGGVANELTSQSSGDTSARYFEGGNVTISIEVIRQVTDNFSENNILGRGGFGIVYKGELHDGTQIAVKRMESNLMGTKGLNEFQAEIAVLTKVRHRHLVALLGFCVNGNERLLVYEYMPQGTLSQHLFDWNNNGGNPLTWKQRVSIALDVARGVEYLHSLAQQSFIHRDLKPTNILLGNDMRAKVADFGLVKNAPDGKYSLETRLAGTFGYLAPEYAATGRVTRKVDVYAYGVVLMEILTGRKALDENLPDEQSHLVTWFRRVLINKNNIIKAIDPTLDPDEETFANITTVAELAGHCTARDPTQRPEMGHAVNILGPLVEQWKPSRHEEEEAYGVDLHMSLPQALQRWQDEGTSTMTSDFYSRTDTSLGNTQTSIPSRPNGFPDTFNSANCR